MLLFALFTGMSIKDSISIFLQKASNISFYKNSNHILKITHDKNIFAKNVYLQADGHFFNDNYFDLIPGIPKIIKTDRPTDNIKVKSLFDTMK